MTSATKQDAGNPHIRIDEAAVASAKPRRGFPFRDWQKFSSKWMTGLALGVVFFLLESLHAATYQVYATEAEAQAAGLTKYGASYIAELYQNSESVTLNIHKGTYDFTDVAEASSASYTAGGASYTVKTYLTTSVAKTRTLKAAGDGEVILTGEGRLVQSGSTTVFAMYDITLDGFSALGDGPGTAKAACYGGAIYGNNNPGNFTASNCVFRNCRAYSGGAVMSLSCTDCVFSNNYAVADGGAASTYGTSAKYTRWFRGCEFRDNAAGGAGGAVSVPTWQTTFTDCWFVNNVATNGSGGAIAYSTVNATGMVNRCVFVENAVYTSSSADYAGGAIGGVSSPSFNVENSFFTNNAAWYAGAASFGNYSNCVFSGNYAYNYYAVKGLRISDAAADFPLTTRVIDSIFVGNHRGDRFGRSYDPISTGAFVGLAHDVRFEICDFTGGDSGFNRCSLDRCTLHDIPGDESAYVFYQENFVSNSLITGCSPNLSFGALVFAHTYSPTTSGNSGLYYAGKNPGAFVNCTIAGNAFNSATLYTQYGLCVADSFINCAFFGNTVNNKSCDMKITCNKTEGLMNVSFSKCAYGSVDAASDYDFQNPAFADNNYQVADPKFVGEGKDVPKYTPKRKSPLFGKGDASMYSPTDVDLVGNLRLREDAGKQLDIGCYQCWIEPAGFMLLFR